MGWERRKGVVRWPGEDGVQQQKVLWERSTGTGQDEAGMVGWAGWDKMDRMRWDESEGVG